MDLGDLFSDIAAFSLAVDDTPTVGATQNDYMFLIYIGAILLVIIIGFIIYKYFTQKKVRFSEQNEVNEFNNYEANNYEANNELE